MLLFKPEHVEPIKRRKKTQTRRTWANCRAKVGSIHQAKTSFKKGEQPFAYIRITAARQEFLGQITDEDARKEGYPHVPAYKKAFKQIYGHWNPHELVWVIDFELVTEAEYLGERVA